MVWTFVLCLVAAMFSVPVASTNSYTYETNLHTALASGYDSTVAPNTTTYINMEFGMMHIDALDTKSERFQLAGFLLMSWTDRRLVWDPISYGNLSSTKSLISTVWTPPIIVGNSADGIKFINDDGDLASVHLKVDDQGNVYWLTPANIDSQCSMDIQYYPFDIQECSILISSWMFTADEIALIALSDEINIDLYEENGEWGLISQSVTTGSRYLHGFALPMIEFTVGFQRKYSYYLLNMMLPVVLLTLIGPLVFALPVECGEKNGFALTILLSMSVLVTVVSDLIPPSSTNVCILSVYLLTAYIMSTVQGFVVVIVCRLHNKTSKGETPGRTIQSVCRHLETLLCYRCAKGNRDDVLCPTKVKPIDEKEAIDIEDEEPKSYVYTYEDFANLIDQFCLYLFYILTILTTLVFLIVLTTGAG